MNQNVFQGVTAPQKDLVAYWCSLQEADGKVRRGRVNPGQFCAMLANISIVEFDPNGTGRFRIAGERLRDVLGVEARGRAIEDVLGTLGETYALGLCAALERGRPVGGMIEKGAQYHAWLRLPLVGKDGRMTQVLCHDELISQRGVRLYERENVRAFPDRAGRAAAA